MKKHKIDVWDYNNTVHGGRIAKEPVKYKVDAWCVGGDEGIRAFFFIDEYFCVAEGDDGHWWIISVCHVDWLEEIKEAINAAKK